MTATIIAFPTMVERDEAEFRRTGPSSYIRACDEAAALWDAARATNAPAGLSQRIDVFAGMVERLARDRSEVVGDLVKLSDGSQIELTIMPRMLRAMCRDRAA